MILNNKKWMTSRCSISLADEFWEVPGRAARGDSITFQNRLIFQPSVAIAGQQPKELAATADSG